MLGSDLVEYLASKFLVTSITKENYSQFVGKAFDVLVNANGNSKRFWAIKNPLEDFVLSTVSVYKSLFDFKFKTYIYVSSSDVYVDHSSNTSTSEDQIQDSSKLSSYGLHKYLSEKIIENNCPNYIILRSSMALGKNLKKGPIYDIFKNKSLFISESSRIQMITTIEIANIIKFFLDQNKTNNVINVGGKGTVNFKKIQTYFSFPVKFLKEAEEQIYEMNVEKLDKLFSIKSSEEYLREFLSNVQ